MKNKKVVIVGVILSIGVGAIGLKQITNNQLAKEVAAQGRALEESARGVQTITVSSMEYAKTLDYLGYVKAEDTKRYAFLSGGQLQEVYAKEGDYVKKGDVLARLDTTQMQFALQNSQETIALARMGMEQSSLQLETATKALAAEEVNLEKLKQTYETNIFALEKQLKIKKDSLELTRALLEIGGASANEYEQRQMDYDVSFEELEALKSNRERDIALGQVAIENAKLNIEKAKLAQHDIDLNQAEIARSQSAQQIEDATLVADAEGYVIASPYQKGEVIGAGSPVVVIRSESVLISIGVSAADYGKITKDQEVIIGNGIKGKIDTIASYPDEATKMYVVHIVTDEMPLTPGEIVDVKLVTEKAEGHFVPLGSIFEKDGLDYVYTIGEGSRLVRMQVTLGQIKENLIQVKGLKDNMQVVTEGLKSLKENEKVTPLGSGE